VGYTSKSEREAASRMAWHEILAHVRQAEQCDEMEARRQIGNAIEDRALPTRWAASQWGASGFMAFDDIPRTADYWRECETDPNDHDAIREPPPYDPLVPKRIARRLDKKRGFRKPIFPRVRVLQIWPERHELLTARIETKAITFLVPLLKTNRDITRGEAWKKCKQKFPTLSERGFRSRIWPDAREGAGLESKAPAGRRPKPKT
jgi:hypothetical protein